MRLDRFLGAAGLSRARARDVIQAGRVTVDGACVRDAAAHVREAQAVALDGVAVAPAGDVHVMLHKPQGVITAARDARAATVFDLLPTELRPRGLCAVGRLDRDTTGLLLLTTDGQLAHRLISPRYEVEKVYRATVEGTLNASHIGRMAEGIALTDFTARPARLEILAPDTARIAVTEGKYHQVKRMFGALGLTVTALHRESVGGVALDPALAPGQARRLTGEEAARLAAVARGA